MRVQWLAGEREVRLAERLVLRRVGVDERGDVLGVGLPVHDELGLADQLADAGADHVHADDRAVLLAHDLDDAGRAEDLALAVAAEVVLVGLDVVAVLLLGLRLGEADRGDLGVAVGDPRDARVDRPARVEPGDLLGDEDALREPAVRELQAGDDVADGVDAVDVGAQALVGDDEAAVEGDAGLFVAEARGAGPRPTATRSRSASNVLPSSSVTVTPASFCSRRRTARRVLKLILRLRNARSSCLDSDASSIGDQGGQRLDDRDVGAEGLPDAGELDADDAAAEDDDRLRAPGRACSAWSLVMTRPPISRPGSVRAYEPVARTTLLAGVARRRRPRPCRSPTSLPSPSTTVIRGT